MPRASRARHAIALGLASLLALGVVGQAVAKPPAGGPAEQKATKTGVQILALNDFHGQLREPDATSSGGRIGATPAGGVVRSCIALR